MPSFDEYIGVRYSGRKGPTERLDDLVVYAAIGDAEPWREHYRTDGEGRWSRQELAAWLHGKLTEEARVIIPHHDTVIESDDHVIVFVPHKRMVLDVEKLFQVGATFL